jgi:methionine-S-sulfoxide reductase
LQPNFIGEELISMRKILFAVTAMALLLALPAAHAQPAKQNAAPRLEKATLAGGCFWCMQPPFDKARGVVRTVVGYTGGKEPNPTYEQVSNKQTSHLEAIEITYDPLQISFEQILDIFWRNIDPTQAGGQFADIGPQYRTAIFYHSEEQKRIAEESRSKLARSGKFSKPIVTLLLPASTFYPAEEYHQKYYLKNPAHYNSYAVGSGRKPFLERVWGKEKP